MKLSEEKLKKIIIKEFISLIDEEALIDPASITITGTGTLKIGADNGNNKNISHKHSKSGSYMAKQQLDKISNYSKKVYDMICHGEQIDDWMESHIAQMADDIGEVYHKLYYHKKKRLHKK